MEEFKECDDWSKKMLEASKNGKRDLELAELHLFSSQDRMSRHQRIIEGSKSAVEFLKLFSSAAARAAQIVNHHKDWLDRVNYSYEIKGIDFENHCINLHFERRFSTEVEPFTLVYEIKNKTRPWGYKVVHGDLLLNTGMSNHYLEGIKDILDIFIKSNKFEDLIKIHQNEFTSKHFDFDRLRKKCDLDRLYKLLNDSEFYSILKSNKLPEIINSYRLFLQAITTRKAEIRLKNIISKTCNFHNMPKPPGAFCKAEDTLGMGVRSGIYFGWRNGKCFYVGKSINIEARLKSHHVINIDDDVSWLEMPPSEIHLNELFYIWLLAPECNDETKLSNKAEKVLINELV